MMRRFDGIAEREDLEQMARLALWQAVQRFDPERGCQFDTFAVPTIVGALMHYLQDRALAVKVPRFCSDLRPRLQREAEAATQSLGREPTVEELATRLGVSEEDVVETMAIRNLYFPVSLEDIQEWPDGEPQTVAEWMGAADPLLKSLELRLLVREALGRLEPRMWEIMYRRFYQGQSQLEVSRRLGISQMHVSRLERQALARLREDLKNALNSEPEAEAPPAQCSVPSSW
jgi:RNA polymerase sigma-B factor